METIDPAKAARVWQRVHGENPPERREQGLPELIAHEWTDATCGTPKTCTKCDLTEGEALGHSWQEADCVTS